MTEVKNKRVYWAVKDKSLIIFKGTYKECWDYFVDQYKSFRVSELIDLGIRVARLQ